jgi:hypothetical protein
MSDENQNTSASPPQDMPSEHGEPREQVLAEFKHPIIGEFITRMLRLPSGLIAVDLESKAAHFFGQRFLPPPLESRDRPGKLASRWIYKSQPK